MKKIAIIVANYEKEIGQMLLDGALTAITDAKGEPPKIFHVPGAVEIPMLASKIIDKFDAILCLGAVIQGETKHFDYVCKIVSEGCMHLAINHKKPVTFGVLTTNNRTEALARAGGAKGNKGYDTMLCTLDMLAIIDDLGPNYD